MKEPSFERKSSVERIIGGNEHEQQNAKEVFEAWFESRSIAERPKSPEEKEIIESILKNFPEFVEKYGGKPLDFKPDHIRIIDPQQVKEEALRKHLETLQEQGEGGWHITGSESVVVFSSENKLVMTERVVHELLHMNSFNSLTIVDSYSGPDQFAAKNIGGAKVLTRRGGFGVVDKSRQKVYFAGVNEAIIEELTIRFIEGHLNAVPVLSEELELRKQIHQDQPYSREILAVVTKQTEGGIFETSSIGYAYPEERAGLGRIIEKVWNTNRDRYESQEDVFQVFARAAMRGELLEVARLIEKTFGKGKFRKLGEMSMKED
jgi:hypothetical protein